MSPLWLIGFIITLVSFIVLITIICLHFFPRVKEFDKKSQKALFNSHDSMFRKNSAIVSSEKRFYDDPCFSFLPVNKYYNKEDPSPAPEDLFTNPSYSFLVANIHHYTNPIYSYEPGNIHHNYDPAFSAEPSNVYHTPEPESFFGNQFDNSFFSNISDNSVFSLNNEDNRFLN